MKDTMIETDKNNIDNVAKEWSKKISKNYEYKFISVLDYLRKKEMASDINYIEKNEVYNDFISLNYPHLIEYSEITKALKLKNQLIIQNSNKKIDEVIFGKFRSNKFGNFYHICNKYKFEDYKIEINKIINKILSDLKLIKGIGKITEEKLKLNGYRDIKDLIYHQKFGSYAKQFINILEQKKIKDLYEWIYKRKRSQSHPLLFLICNLIPLDKLLFIDIETLGLYTQPIILTGIARIKNNEIIIDQFLTLNLYEEPAMLFATISYINEDNIILSYNGKNFDIPYLDSRLIYYGILNESISNIHLDLFHFCKRLFKNRFPNLKLSTLEQFLLGLKRNIEVPSFLVPEFYYEYLKINNPGPLIPIIQHNKQDLITLIKLFLKLYENIIDFY